ncbi:MAG: CvpA family protein, partial [Rubrobacteraceae bacterium]
MFSDFTTLDVFIGLFVLLIVVRGARTGFLAGVFSLVGVVIGASVGSRVARHLLPEGESAVFSAGITLASILAFAVLGDVIARSVGGSIRSRLTSPTSSALDGLGGAALGLALSLTLVWAVGVFALQTPPLAGVHPTLQNSRVLQELNQRMPSKLLTTAVARLDPLPQIRGPEVNVEAPDGSVIQDPDVLAATAGTVRITGIACGYGVEGSGWVAAPDLVVTNAHVVAGEAATRVQPGGSGPT